MWALGGAWDDEAALARAWGGAQPFSHLIFDDFVPTLSLGPMLEMLDEEPLEPYAADIYAFEASRPEPRTEGLSSLRDAFAAAVAPALSRVTGRVVRRADMRVYAYEAGHYLLPHSDHQEGVGRALAYALYLPSPSPPTGGELELFRCELDAGELVSAESAELVEPRPNRLVVFEVGHASLHQVREVLSGVRISLSGWLYP
jgi:Rps23 Pro-64 3,4-dihydroxylase Tpa1-like proline 4-hydroxylase